MAQNARPRSLVSMLLASAIAVTLSPATALAAPPAKNPPAKKAKKKKGGMDIDMDVQTFTLDNGLRVYVVEDHSTPAFNISLLYDVGSANEEKGRTGFAHFFEHMMFMGSKNMARMSIGNNTKEAGGNFNAGTSYDQTVYFHNLPSNYLDMVLWGEADRMAALEITDESFETQRAAVKSEKNRMENQPYASSIQDELLPKLFEGTPYEHSVIGYTEDLNAATVEDVTKFFNLYYKPNNCIMTIVGDVDFAEVKTKVEKYFGPIPKGDPIPPLPPSNQARDRKLDKRIVDDKAQQNIYFVAWPTVGQSSEERAALDLLGGILLTGESARLPKVLTDDKKLTAGAGGAHFALRSAGGIFMQMVPTDGATKKEIQDVIKEEIAKMAKSGPTKKELEKARNQKIMETVSSLGTNSGRANSIASDVQMFGDPKHSINELEAYEKVTAKDIKKAAEKYINENWLFFEIGPDDK